MTLSIAVILAIGTIIFTLFVRAKDVPEPAPVSPTAHLEERKAQIYENLRDLQFEFRVGKLSESDYQKTKLDLQRELARVLAEIDALQPAQPAQAKVTKAPAAPAARVHAPGNGNKADVHACPHCGAAFPQAMKFCGECGKAMVS
ncbi:MAG TPA: zinc ribbon domain-containing protein [Bryobacteraceae bacterium]|nr:zinc ribbon domain-containing protein [Bryobacteraceae bacterium]